MQVDAEFLRNQEQQIVKTGEHSYIHYFDPPKPEKGNCKKPEVIARIKDNKKDEITKIVLKLIQTHTTEQMYEMLLNDGLLLSDRKIPMSRRTFRNLIGHIRKEYKVKTFPELLSEIAFERLVAIGGKIKCRAACLGEVLNLPNCPEFSNEADTGKFYSQRVMGVLVRKGLITLVRDRNGRNKGTTYTLTEKGKKWHQ